MAGDARPRPHHQDRKPCRGRIVRDGPGDRSGVTPVTSRREIDAELVDRASRGELTRGNTEKGTPERRAVNRVSYLNRKSSRPGLSAHEALGHNVGAARAKVASFYAADPARFVILEGVTGGEMRRAGLYMIEVRKLVEFKRRGGLEWNQAAAAFERRFSRWKPIRGRTLLSNPEAAVALAEELRAADTAVVFDSGRSRPGRRRRT